MELPLLPVCEEGRTLTFPNSFCTKFLWSGFSSWLPLRDQDTVIPTSRFSSTDSKSVFSCRRNRGQFSLHINRLRLMQLCIEQPVTRCSTKTTRPICSTLLLWHLYSLRVTLLCPWLRVLKPLLHADTSITHSDKVVEPELLCGFCNIPNAERLNFLTLTYFENVYTSNRCRFYKQHNMKIQHH